MAKLYGVFTCPQCGEERKYYDKQQPCYACRWWAKHHAGEKRVPKRIRDGFYTEHKDVYDCYLNMKKRCLNKNTTNFNDYGGRGIKICDRWLGPHGFRNFLSDMGDRPSKEYSIGRINNNDGYKPENCRWETPNQQAVNKRNNIPFPGVSYSKSSHMWRARYQKNGVSKCKYFRCKNDAIIQRRLWEDGL